MRYKENRSCSRYCTFFLVCACEQYVSNENWNCSGLCTFYLVHINNVWRIPQLGKVSRKKVEVLLDFVPSPKFGQLLLHFWNANVPKNLGRGLPLPPHPQIDPLYTVCEKRTKNLGKALPSPPHLDKIQKNSYFFFGTFAYSVR